MEIQNISVNFLNGTITGYYQNSLYKNLTISNMAALKAELEYSYSIVAENVVVQYTKDQSLSEPRILANSGSIPTEDTLANIAINYPQLNTELTTMKTEIEAEITLILKAE